jgi:HAMP domain-containing protein
VGETSAETKRQVDETREHLDRTIQALEFRARRNLDVGYQLRSNRGMQLALSGLVIGAAAVTALLLYRRSRESRLERLARKLKLRDLRERVNDFREDAGAWAAAQRRILRAESKSKQAELERKETILRRLLISAAEAALTAAATSMVKRIITTPAPPNRAVMSKQH